MKNSSRSDSRAPFHFPRRQENNPRLAEIQTYPHTLTYDVYANHCKSKINFLEGTSNHHELYWDYTIPYLFSNFPTSSNCTQFITIPRYSSNFAQDAFVIMLGPTFQLSLASFGDTTERTKQNRFMTVWPRMPKKDWWPFLVDIFIAS